MSSMPKVCFGQCFSSRHDISNITHTVQWTRCRSISDRSLTTLCFHCVFFFNAAKLEERTSESHHRKTSFIKRVYTIGFPAGVLVDLVHPQQSLDELNIMLHRSLQHRQPGLISLLLSIVTICPDALRRQTMDMGFVCNLICHSRSCRRRWPA